MISEISASHKINESFRHLAQVLTGRTEAKKSKGGLLTPLFNKILRAG